MVLLGGVIGIVVEVLLVLWWRRYIYIYTTILPWSCTDGRYFYHISGTALFSGTNFGFFGTIVIFLLHFGYTCPNQEIGFKWK